MACARSINPTTAFSREEHLMAKTVADVMQMVKDNEVKFVDFRFTDTRARSSTCPCRSRTSTKTKFVSGHAFDGSSIAGWKGIEASDMLLMPDPNTANVDPSSKSPPDPDL